MLLLVEPCVASITKPATPTFTVEEIAYPYDIPPSTTTTVDPYTGEETTKTYPGYHVENKTTYIKIKNQPFTPYKNSDGDTMYLYYEYRFKGHYVDYWSEYNPYNKYYWQSDSEYTLIPFPSIKVPQNCQMDIQVRALIGVVTSVEEWWMIGRPVSYNFKGIKGDWSDIVVVSFNPLSFTVLPSTSTPSTNTPDQLTPDYTTPPSTTDHIDPQPPNSPPQQSPWASYLLTIIVTACIITIPIAIVTYLNKQQKRKNNNPITQTAFAVKITMEGVKHGTVV